MKCANHPELDTVGACVRCGKELCIECKKELDEKLYCQSCAAVGSRVSSTNGGAREAIGYLPRTEKCAKASNGSKATAAMAYAALICGIAGASIIAYIIIVPNSNQYGDTHVETSLLLFLLAVIFGVVSLILRAVSPKTSPHNHNIAIAGKVSPHTSSRNRNIAIAGTILGASFLAFFFILILLALFLAAG